MSDKDKVMAQWFRDNKRIFLIALVVGFLTSLVINVLKEYMPYLVALLIAVVAGGLVGMVTNFLYDRIARKP